MPEQYCGECGAAVSGPFCGRCGARVGSGDEDATSLTQSTATSGTEGTAATMGSDEAVHDEPTSYRSLGSASQAAPYSSYSPGQAPTGTTSASAATPAGHTPRSKNRTNQMLIALIALVSVAVAGMLGYLFLRPGHSHDAKSPTVTQPTGALPTASTSSTSSTPPTSSRSSAASSTQSQSTEPTNDSASVPPAAAATSESSSASSTSDGNGFDSLPGVEKSTTYDGTQYAMTRSGNTVTVYKNDGGQPKSLGSIPFDGAPKEWGFISLSGCSAPIVYNNASVGMGSAAYAIGSGGTYEALHGHSDHSLYAEGGPANPPREYGVNENNGRLEMRDDEKHKTRGQGNMFDSCSSQNPDVVHQVGF